MIDSEFNIYIKRLQGQMLRFAISILRSEEDARDVVAHVNEQLWRKREALKSNGSASTYAMTAVRNRCYDFSQYRQRRRGEALDESLCDEGSSGEARDTIEFVRFAMAQLPDRQREILHLKDIEGYSTHEIAEIFVIEETNVRVILGRARGALKEIIIKKMR